jgi:hypothetical protein
MVDVTLSRSMRRIACDGGPDRGTRRVHPQAGRHGRPGASSADCARIMAPQRLRLLRDGDTIDTNAFTIKPVACGSLG